MKHNKPQTHVKVYHCIQCGAEVKDAALFCSKRCRREWDKANSVSAKGRKVI